MIVDDDIAKAEKVLLPDGLVFDKQRKDFIKNLQRIDLQAVPGSGKTTALLAKLIILEKHLPFKDGSGILVISHTNTAINEIKERIGSHCPKLFNYPNFVGTIQSFVDYFLATPFFVNLHNRKPYRIDDEIYEEKLYIPANAQAWVRNNPHIGQEVIRYSRLNNADDLVWGFNQSGEFPLKTKTNQTYLAIRDMKRDLRNKGALCFDDAYFLALKAIEKYPLIKKFVCLRFRYVFVDEMQDMDKHQYDLLETLFYDNGKSNVIFQRIGDKNQAIFSGVVKLEDFWKSDGRNVLRIDGSCRFSNEIANVIKSFALEPQVVEGKSKHTSLKPHLLIYKTDTILNVLPKFIDLLKEKVAVDASINLNGQVKAIGWRKDAGEGKIAIKNYFPQFNDDIHSNKIDYPDIKGYLHNTKMDIGNQNALAEIRKNILNAFLRILRYENIVDQDGRYYSKRRLINFLKEETPIFYDQFKLKLFIWAKCIYIGDVTMAFANFKADVLDFLRVAFNKTSVSDATMQFIESQIQVEEKTLVQQREDASSKPHNIFEREGYCVEVGTIHSIKGETHTATLYMETYYQNDSRKKGESISYESQRLKEFFKGNNTKGGEGSRTKESLKMAFVGMSRPTHLLCVAVHEDHVKDYLHEIPDNLWEKIEIS